MRNFHVRMLLTVGALGLISLVAAQAQQPATGQAPAAPAGVRRAAPDLQERCGGRSQQADIPCANHVMAMMTALEQVPTTPPATPLKPRKVLIWSRLPSDGWQHSSIPLAAKLIEELGKRTGAWTSVTGWDLTDMAPEKLGQYDAIFLSSTTGAFLDDSDAAATAARRKALLDFIRGGKGIAGIHATGDSYHGNKAWPEWDRIIGGYFKYHWDYPTPITVKVEDPNNPVNAAFKGRNFNVADEIYTFDGWQRDNVHVLLSIDYSLMTDADKKLERRPRSDGDYALAWLRPEGNGRLFFNALGHHETVYGNNPAFLQHILAGMQYALGDLKADDSIKKK
jgi:type 1 glutamine amidotransferase